MRFVTCWRWSVMNKRQNFEDFLVARNDVLDNAAHELAMLMLSANGTPLEDDQFPWDMEIIGAILESIKSILEEEGYQICWPHHENTEPCIDTDSCKYEGCPLK